MASMKECVEIFFEKNLKPFLLFKNTTLYLHSQSATAGWLVLKTLHAEVAQLVEHHLAKVEVAGSNLVFRSKNSIRTSGWNFLFTAIFGALVAKLVDAQDLKSCLQQCKCGFKSRLGHRLQPIRKNRLFYWVKHGSNISPIKRCRY